MLRGCGVLPTASLILEFVIPVRSICLILIGLALTISGYLLFRHFALADLSAQMGTDFCSTLFGRGCDDALRSPSAIQFGLPLAGWGLVYYGTLVLLLLLAWMPGETFGVEAMTGAFVLALGAAVGSLALFVAMATEILPFCPMCATVHAINVLLLFPLKRMTGRSMGQLACAVGSAVRYIVGGKTVDPAAARWQCVGFLVPGLVAVIIYQWVFVEYTLHAHAVEGSFDPVQTWPCSSRVCSTRSPSLTRTLSWAPLMRLCEWSCSMIFSVPGASNWPGLYMS